MWRVFETKRGRHWKMSGADGADATPPKSMQCTHAARGDGVDALSDNVTWACTSCSPDPTANGFHPMQAVLQHFCSVPEGIVIRWTRALVVPEVQTAPPLSQHPSLTRLPTYAPLQPPPHSVSGSLAQRSLSAV